jgi:hypothetical protein
LKISAASFSAFRCREMARIGKGGKDVAQIHHLMDILINQMVKSSASSKMAAFIPRQCSLFVLVSGPKTSHSALRGWISIARAGTCREPKHSTLAQPGSWQALLAIGIGRSASCATSVCAWRSVVCRAVGGRTPIARMPIWQSAPPDRRDSPARSAAAQASFCSFRPGGGLRPDGAPLSRSPR